MVVLVLILVVGIVVREIDICRSPGAKIEVEGHAGQRRREVGPLWTMVSFVETMLVTAFPISSL